VGEGGVETGAGTPPHPGNLSNALEEALAPNAGPAATAVNKISKVGSGRKWRPRALSSTGNTAI
jgi:hypothetical protein